MAFKGLCQLRLERRTAARSAKAAIPCRATGAACNLRKLRRIESAELIAVELAIRSERNMVDVEIESHADCIGGDQILDIARLIELDLRITGTGRERPEHDRGTASLPPDQFGNRVNLLCRESDHGRTARQPRELFLAGEGQL
jgi:hypothetical protein